MANHFSDVVRCSLSIPNLVDLTAISQGVTGSQSLFDIIADFPEGVDVWKSETALTNERLVTRVRLPADRRLVLRATVAHTATAPGAVARIMADIADALVRAKSQ